MNSIRPDFTHRFSRRPLFLWPFARARRAKPLPGRRRSPPRYGLWAAYAMCAATILYYVVLEHGVAAPSLFGISFRGREHGQERTVGVTVCVRQDFRWAVVPFNG